MLDLRSVKVSKQGWDLADCKWLRCFHVFNLGVPRSRNEVQLLECTGGLWPDASVNQFDRRVASMKTGRKSLRVRQNIPISKTCYGYACGGARSVFRNRAHGYQKLTASRRTTAARPHSPGARSPGGFCASYCCPKLHHADSPEPDASLMEPVQQHSLASESANWRQRLRRYDKHEPKQAATVSQASHRAKNGRRV